MIADLHAKCAGISEADSRRAPLVSSPLMTVSGLVSHLRWVEYWWFHVMLLGEDDHGPWTDEDPDREMRIAASHLRGLRASSPHRRPSPAGRFVSVDTVLPQSFLQEYMAAGKREHPNAGWNMLLPWRLRGPLDSEALRAGLDEVVRRHEVLRTSLDRDSTGRPVQVVRPPAPVPLPEVDLRQLPAAELKSTLDRITRAEHATAFSHASGPLLASRLVRVATRITTCSGRLTMRCATAGRSA